MDRTKGIWEYGIHGVWSTAKWSAIVGPDTSRDLNLLFHLVLSYVLGRAGSVAPAGSVIPSNI